MKTRSIARGIGSVIALASAIGAVGCSGEPLSPEEAAEIGVTSQALTVLSPIASTMVAAQTRSRAASCVLKDQNTNDRYLVIAGGQELNASNVASDKVSISLSGSGAFSTPGGAGKVLTTARFDLAGIVDPADPERCIFAGGRDNNGNAVAIVDEVTIANGVLAVTQRASLQVSRAKFQMNVCGSKLIAFGGEDTSGAALRDIEFSANSPYSGAWTNTANALDIPRAEFALAKDPSADRYVAAGGLTTSGALDDTYELITTSSCSPTSTQITSSPKLADQVFGNVGFFEGTQSGSTTQFVFAGGSDGADEETTSNVIEVNWSTLTASSIATPTITGTFRPTLVHTGSGQAMLVGGELFDESASLNVVQQYKSNAWETPGTLSVARFSPAAELIAGTVFIATGENIGGSNSLATDRVTP